MKMMTLLAAAGLALSSLAVAAPAEAQRYGYDRGHERGYDRGDYQRWDRGNHNGWERGRHRGWERSRHYRGRHYRSNRVCWTEWRYRERVTVCRRRR